MAKIVCIEDEPDIREDIVETLVLAGHTLVQAENGQIGLEVILREKPDLVISDITMPVMDGLGVVYKIRTEHEELADMPFVFLSALADRKDQINGRETGADEYLTKPVDFELLQAVVNSRLRQVERMRNQKDRQLLKMYGALTRAPVLEDMPNAQGPLDGARLNIISIASEDVDMTDIHQAIQSSGHALYCLNSGRKFLENVETLAPDLLLVTFDSADIQAPMMVKMLRESGEHAFPIILLLPPSAADFPAMEKLPNFTLHMRIPVDVKALMQHIGGISRHLRDCADLLATG